MPKVVGRDESAVKRVTCKMCASIIEYTLSEVESIHGTDYSGGPDGCEYIKCPSCGKQIVLRSW